MFGVAMVQLVRAMDDGPGRIWAEQRRHDRFLKACALAHGATVPRPGPLVGGRVWKRRGYGLRGCCADVCELGAKSAGRRAFWDGTSWTTGLIHVFFFFLLLLPSSMWFAGTYGAVDDKGRG